MKSGAQDIANSDKVQDTFIPFNKSSEKWRPFCAEAAVDKTISNRYRIRMTILINRSSPPFFESKPLFSPTLSLNHATQFHTSTQVRQCYMLFPYFPHDWARINSGIAAELSPEPSPRYARYTRHHTALPLHFFCWNFNNWQVIDALVLHKKYPRHVDHNYVILYTLL